MHIWILMRILAGFRMLNHPTRGLRFLNYPSAITFFQIVGDLHAGSRGCADLWPEDNFSVRLISVDGNAADIHIHGAHIESTDAVEMLLPVMRAEMTVSLPSVPRSDVC